MLQFLLFLILALICQEAHAGWVEERWTDSQGRNHQGTVSPPSRNTYSSPANNAPAPAPAPDPAAEARKHQSRAEAYFDQGDWLNAAIEAYECLKLSGFQNVRVFFIWARAYELQYPSWNEEDIPFKRREVMQRYEALLKLDPDHAEARLHLNQLKAYFAEQQRRQEQARQRDADHARQRQQARQRVQALLKDTAVDFDGTGRGVDLTPMTQQVTDHGGAAAGEGAGHLDAGTVDLRFMDPDKLGTPGLPASTPAAAERGVHYGAVPLPEAVLPKDPQERFAMKDSATHILDALQASGGDLPQALENMEHSLKVNGADNQAGQEAYSYLLGLYVSEVVYGDGQKDPFKAGPADSRELLQAVAYLDPGQDAYLLQDAEEKKNGAIIQEAFQSQNACLERTLAKHHGDLEKALQDLRQATTPGERYAYRFLQGLLAWRDMKSLNRPAGKP